MLLVLTPGGASSDVPGAARGSGYAPDASVSAAAPMAAGGAAAARTAAATIEGTVRMKPVPQRRTASRYPGAAGMAARPVQQIAPVVYLKGGRPSAGSASAAPEMAQEDTAFLPSLLVVPVGTTVRFPNHDPFFHNVFSYSSAGRFDLGRYPRGESKEVTLAEPGLVKVYCEVHESMRSAILVVDNPYWAVPDAQGRFRIADVPSGRYTLVAWHADRGEREVPLTVPASGVVRIDIEL